MRSHSRQQLFCETQKEEAVTHLNLPCTFFSERGQQNLFFLSLSIIFELTHKVSVKSDVDLPLMKWYQPSALD